MKKRKTFLYLFLAMVIVFVGLTPLAVDASSLTPGNSAISYQGSGPTATPDDPIWLAFVAARAALEEKTGGDFTYVRLWEYEETEWKAGIDDCRTLEEGETERQLYFGWTFVFTALNGNQYEVRTSFNYQIVAVCDKVTVAAVGTPVPQGTANPNLPAPITAAALSGGFELGGQVIGLYPGTRSAFSTAKMKWVKFQLGVGMDASALISEAHSVGLKILFSVVGDKNQIMNSGYQDTYASYVAGLASKGADAIEVWNEQNIDREWPAGQINGANYVPLLAKAYNAIKAAKSSTLVIAGAPSPTGFFGTAGCTAQGCNDDVYYQQMAAAGASQYADCIGVHYNEGIVSPQQSTGDPRGDNYPTRYYGTMLNRALAPFGGKQACFTEIGYLSPEGYGALPGGFAWAQNVTIAQQAQWLAQAASLSASSGRVRLMIIFNVDFTTWGSDPQAGYAIIRKDGTCPACSALGSVMP